MGIPFDPAAVELPSTLIGYAATLPYPPSEVVKIAETQIERNDPNYIRGVVSGLGLLENFKRTVTNNKTGDQQTLIQSRIPMLGLSDATENKLVYLSNLYAMQDGVLYDEQITSYKTNAKKRLEELNNEILKIDIKAVSRRKRDNGKINRCRTSLQKKLDVKILYVDIEKMECYFYKYNENHLKRRTKVEKI